MSLNEKFVKNERTNDNNAENNWLPVIHVWLEILGDGQTEP